MGVRNEWCGIECCDVREVMGEACLLNGMPVSLQTVMKKAMIFRPRLVFGTSRAMGRPADPDGLSDQTRIEPVDAGWLRV
jgi:hypothetical protein